MRLNGIDIPNGYNGIGMHDTVGDQNCVWDYATSMKHAIDELLPRGITAFKLFGNTTKMERARAYVDAGILTFVRPWYLRPWGQNPNLWIMPDDQIRMLVDVGVQGIEFGNEYNIADEWVNGTVPNASTIAVAVRQAWEAMLEKSGRIPGYVPILPSNTPGGHVDHRLCIKAIIAEFKSKGLLDTVKHIAIHPRPLNQPPELKWTAERTCTFDEHNWIRLQWEQAGVNAYYWATEHGYSPFDNAPSGYPELSLDNWLEWNWKLFKWMHPGDQNAIHPSLAGLFYWYWAGMGTWSAWSRDALVDPQDTRLTKPTTLWVRMKERSQELRFSRYSEVPQPTERAKGINVSYVQSKGIRWANFIAGGNDFYLPRMSQGLTMDASAFGHFDQAWYRGVYTGPWHVLRPDIDSKKQARFFEALCRSVTSHTNIVPATVDVELDGLNAAKVKAFILEWFRLTDRQLMVYTSWYQWDRLVIKTLPELDDMSWAAKCLLWVADARDVKEPLLPKPWSTWTLWQWGSKWDNIFDGNVDRNVYNGTLEQMLEKFSGTVEPPKPPYRVRHEDGGPYIIGNYPIPNLQVTARSSWGNVETTTTGSKPEYGIPGGFLISAPPERSPYLVEIEGKKYDVDVYPGQKSIMEWDF